MQDRFIPRLFLVTLAALVVVSVYQLLPVVRTTWLEPQAEPRLVTARGDLAPSERTTIELFEAARGSVVFITTAQSVRDLWSRRIYEQERGSGSGFFWDNLGHVVTNNHVIEGASSATVRLADGRSFPARLVGRAPGYDLAVLRIEARDLPPALPVGQSETLSVGQGVLAIGNPFGLDWTLTTGIVSALDRELPAARGRAITGLIQTDAAINPGNSGGPLLDSAGRLIGVNTAIFSPSGASAGIGFAVPVDTVNRVVPQLIDQGQYAPPSTGVIHDARVNELARAQGLEGVLVLGLEPGSPAAEAGLEPARMTEGGRIVPGDIIVGVAGQRVRSIADYLAVLDGFDAGDRVTLTLRRGGSEREVDVALAPGA